MDGGAVIKIIERPIRISHHAMNAKEAALNRQHLAFCRAGSHDEKKS
jgi:hypothetical protein